MKTVMLSNKKEVKIVPGKGKHLLNAQKKAKSPDEIPFALIAELIKIDDKKVMYEDLLEFALADMIMLQEAVLGN